MAHRHRPTHAVLLVFVLAANAALAPCDGWQPTADARKACCTGAEHACSQARADDCCAAGEQRQHGETTGVVIHALTAAPATDALYAAAPVLAAIRAGLLSSDTPFGSPPDTHVLLSVFRI